MNHSAFEIPQEWLEQQITIALAIPLQSKEGLGFPETDGVLLKIMATSIVLLVTDKKTNRQEERVYGLDRLMFASKKRVVSVVTPSIITGPK